MFLEPLEAVPPGRVLWQSLRDPTAAAAVLLDVDADPASDCCHRQSQRVVHVAKDPPGTLAGEEVQGVRWQLVCRQACRDVALAAASYQASPHSTLKHLLSQIVRPR